jgi:hypothetical protein
MWDFTIDETRVRNSAKKWSDGWVVAFLVAKLRQNMEKFPAMATKVARVSL